MKLRLAPPIPIWPATAPRDDKQSHWWYRAIDGEVRRVCDDQAWPSTRMRSVTSKHCSPCKDCNFIYARDISLGMFRMVVVWSPRALISPNGPEVK